MAKYYYHVDGSTFRDTKEYGNAWRNAVGVAQAVHCEIMRTISRKGILSYEYYADNFGWLDEKYRKNFKAKKF